MTNETTASTAPPTAPLGGFREVDGRRLYVHRSGEGGPAVVFLPGASAIGLDYYGIQQDVADFAARSGARTRRQTRLDAAMVGAVTRGEQRILPDTGHSRLCFERADAVVQAIRDVVDWARRG